jgi:hypothetical protein
MDNERLKCGFCFVGLIIINLMVAVDSTTLSVALPVGQTSQFSAVQRLMLGNRL